MKQDLRNPVRGTVLRDVVFETTALGANVVSGVLWSRPGAQGGDRSGEHIRTTWHALSGRPGGDFVRQIVFTPIGIFATDHDCYSIGACFK